MQKRYFILIQLVIMTILSGYAQSVIPNRVGINTDTPLSTLHVDGDLRIRNAGFYSTDFTPLVIDENGLIGKYNGVINNMFYAQSKTRTLLSATDITNINNDGYIVPWAASDIKYNPNILSLDSDNRTFTLAKDGLFEVSGMVSYNPQTASSSNSVGVNVLIQYLPSGTSTWITIAGTRYLLIIPFTNVAGTVNISPAIQRMNVGDKIRIQMVRAGAQHGTAGTPVIEADDFTKMLRVMYL